MNHNIKTAHPVVVDVLARKSAYKLKFEDGDQYDSVMRLAYSRTVRDLEALGKNLKVLEIGAFTGIVSAALANLGHDVTASDIPFVLADERNAAFLRSEGVKTIPHDLSVLPFPASSSVFPTSGIPGGALVGIDVLEVQCILHLPARRHTRVHTPHHIEVEREV